MPRIILFVIRLGLLAIISALVSGVALGGGTCTQLPPGAVGWWPGEGDAIDLFGAHDGSAENGLTFSASHVDLGFDLDGVDDYVEVPHDAGLDLPAFTVAAWVFLDNSQKAGEVEMLVTKGTGSSGAGGFLLVYDDRQLSVLGDLFGDTARSATTNAARIEIYAAPAVVGRAWLTHAWNAARFYHVVATFDGAAPVLFLDGKRVSDGNAVAGIAFNTLPLRIGAAAGGAPTAPFGPFEGRIDEVQLFDRVLTDCEIRRLFEAGTLGACKGDTDGDSIVDFLDNCPEVPNAPQSDADDDGWGDECDCNDLDPGVLAPPVESDGLRLSGDDLDWCSEDTASGTATTYDVLRGDLGELPVGSGALEFCLEDDLPASSTTDTDPLLEGEGLWYLVRPENSCGVGTYGFESDDDERLSTICP